MVVVVVEGGGGVGKGKGEPKRAMESMSFADQPMPQRFCFF